MTADDLDMVRAIVLLGQAGRCPFCLADAERESPTLEAVRRGLTGDDLRTAIANTKQRLVAAGIDPETMHRANCRREAVLASLCKVEFGAMEPDPRSGGCDQPTCMRCYPEPGDRR